MADFVAGEAQVLVSTSVIEVGVDVANAVVMVILGARRFGLSQLHQLRGRVGRGVARSFCFLLAEAEEGEASERLALFAVRQMASNWLRPTYWHVVEVSCSGPRASRGWGTYRWPR